MQVRNRYDGFHSDHHDCVIGIMVYKKKEKRDRNTLNKSVSFLCQNQYIFRSAPIEVTVTFLKGYLTSK
jgi:hypothetical protein